MGREAERVTVDEGFQSNRGLGMDVAKRGRY
jgi:hypothetical protein